MYRVAWTDAKGRPTEITSDLSDARQLFAIIVRAAIRGQAADVLLISPDGNFVDTWGT